MKDEFTETERKAAAREFAGALARHAGEEIYPAVYRVSTDALDLITDEEERLP